MVLVLVKETRDIMPSIGTRKLIHEIRSQLRDHRIKMGRDQLFDLLRFHGLLVRRRKRGVRTTDSCHWLKKYPNLIVALDLTSPEQLWVSDITYVRTMEGYSYLSLITDAYSRKIVGHALHPSLESKGCIIALTMALDGRLYRDSLLIHHSDRGSQYCCKQYVDVLTSAGIAISMTENGDPYENALAERMNGIIKGEFNLYSSQLNFEQTHELVAQSIDAYNDIRPHSSCDYLTPNQAHQTLTPMKKRWKNYPRLGTEQEAGPAPIPEQGTGSCSPSSKKQYLGPGRHIQP